jgi:hypothetical protein
MLFGKLRAANKISLASTLVQKQLELEAACGTFKGETKATADKLVFAIWSDIPALRNLEELPRAATLAGAAMANGIRHFDEAGDSKFGDLLFRCLGAYLQHVFPKLVLQPEYLRGIDRHLLDLAFVPIANAKPRKAFPDDFAEEWRKRLEEN